jgi:hypothetical protein
MGNFPGDETAEWDGGSGIKSLAPDMLNRAVGGAFGYSTDIGGYLDRFNPPADEELWTRWHEWAALTPYFRLHNSQTSGTRMPWHFGDAGYARWEALARLHERAVPYIRSLWEAGRRTGMPPTRPMWLAFPGDRAAAKVDQQWMLGDDVLVAPVVDRGATARDVYVPAGCWEHGETGERVQGAGLRRVEAPLGRLPYLFAAGRSPSRRSALLAADGHRHAHVVLLVEGAQEAVTTRLGQLAPEGVADRARLGLELAHAPRRRGQLDVVHVAGVVGPAPDDRRVARDGQLGRREVVVDHLHRPARAGVGRRRHEGGAGERGDDQGLADHRPVGPYFTPVL